MTCIAAQWKLLATARLTIVGDVVMIARQLGFSYLAVLFIVAVLAASLAATSELRETSAKREKERELAFIGHQYSQALTSYYHQSPGGFKELPKKIDDLLKDSRFVSTKRHLRKRFADPVTGGDWGVVQDEGGRISAVYSMSGGAVLQTTVFADMAVQKKPIIGKLPILVYSDVQFKVEMSVSEVGDGVAQNVPGGVGPDVVPPAASDIDF